MRSIDLSIARWKKSSYSNSTGGQCVEVSHDFLSEATWRKSTYSNSTGGECLEVSDDLDAVVPVRDSKAPLGPVLVFPARDWASFVSAVRGRQLTV